MISEKAQLDFSRRNHSSPRMPLDVHSSLKDVQSRAWARARVRARARTRVRVSARASARFNSDIL